MKQQPMQPSITELADTLSADNAQLFVKGDLYLYHRTNRRCPAHSSLWGIFDRTEEGAIYLETSSPDLQKFRYWHRLPAEYRYCRTATRAELRDYVAVLTYCECCQPDRALRLLRPYPASGR